MASKGASKRKIIVLKGIIRLVLRIFYAFFWIKIVDNMASHKAKPQMTQRLSLGGWYKSIVQMK